MTFFHKVALRADGAEALMNGGLFEIFSDFSCISTSVDIDQDEMGIYSFFSKLNTPNFIFIDYDVSHKSSYEKFHEIVCTLFELVCSVLSTLGRKNQKCQKKVSG
jgi:hypothetical protein